MAFQCASVLALLLSAATAVLFVVVLVSGMNPGTLPASGLVVIRGAALPSDASVVLNPWGYCVAAGSEYACFSVPPDQIDASSLAGLVAKYAAQLTNVSAAFGEWTSRTGIVRALLGVGIALALLATCFILLFIIGSFCCNMGLGFYFAGLSLFLAAVLAAAGVAFTQIVTNYVNDALSKSRNALLAAADTTAQPGDALWLLVAALCTAFLGSILLCCASSQRKKKNKGSQYV